MLRANALPATERQRAAPGERDHPADGAGEARRHPGSLQRAAPVVRLQAHRDVSRLRRWRRLPLRDRHRRRGDRPQRKCRPAPGEGGLRLDRAGELPLRARRRLFPQSSYEENYQQLAADAVPDARLAYLPITVQTGGVLRRLHRIGSARLSGTVAASACPASPRSPATSRAIRWKSRCSAASSSNRWSRSAPTTSHARPATRTFPWRVLMVSPDAAGLLGNDLVYRLAQSAGAAGRRLDPARPVHRRVDHQPAAARRRFQRAGSTPRPTATTSTSPPSTASST